MAMIIDPTLVDVGHVVSESIVDIFVLNSDDFEFVGDALQSITEINTEGLSIDLSEIEDFLPLPEFEFEPGDSRTFPVTVSATGPEIINATYRFNFSGAGDIDVVFTGSRAAQEVLEPFPHLPQHNMSVSYEWKTDVINSKASEQRHALRPVPRVVLNYNYQFVPQVYAKVKGLLNIAFAERFQVPKWHERTTASANIGDTAITVDTARSTFRIGSYGIIYSCDDEYDILSINDVTASSVAFSQGLQRNYINAIIAPLEVGSLLRPPQFQRTKQLKILAGFEFLITRGKDISSSNYPLFKSQDVFTDRSIIKSRLSERINQEVVILDNDLYDIIIDPIKDFIDHQHTIEWQINDKQALYELIQWFYHIRGRQKTFWLPTWNRDFVIINDVSLSDTTIDVTFTGYSDSYDSAFILIQLKNSDLLYNKIISSIDNGNNTETLTLETPISQAFLSADVNVCCFMINSRLSSDKITVNYGIGVLAGITVQTTGVPFDG